VPARADRDLVRRKERGRVRRRDVPDARHGGPVDQVRRAHAVRRPGDPRAVSTLPRRDFLGALAWPAAAAALPAGAWLKPGASLALADLAGDARPAAEVARDEDFWFQ